MVKAASKKQPSKKPKEAPGSSPALPPVLEGLPDGIDLGVLEESFVAEQNRRHTEFKLKYFSPYPKQLAFFNAGKQHRERAMIAGNRVGKTECGAAELAYHLTGQYPTKWWQGKTFDKPVRAWAAGVTNESTRDVLQEKLLGPALRRAEWGSGMIPKNCIGDISMARGTADLIDSISVKHVSGGYSNLQLKSYSEGRTKWQGVALEVVWLDEEPPEDLYFEALTRTNETDGVVYLTATPMLGMTSVIRLFLHEGQKI